MNKYPSVLIADDDGPVRNALIRFVKSTLPSAHITAFDNGKDALDFFRLRGADLVISNFNMPKMDGPEFVQGVRQNDRKIPVIMVSGNPGAEAEGLAAGIDRFIDKCEIVELLPDAIRSLIGAEKIPCLNRYLSG